jgi:hypothetical protein
MQGGLRHQIGRTSQNAKSVSMQLIPKRSQAGIDLSSPWHNASDQQIMTQGAFEDCSRDDAQRTDSSTATQVADFIGAQQEVSSA